MFLLFLAMMICPLSQSVFAKQVVITLESDQNIQVNTYSQGEHQSYQVPGDTPAAAVVKPLESTALPKPTLEKSFDIGLAKFINLASITVLTVGSIAVALKGSHLNLNNDVSKLLPTAWAIIFQSKGESASSEWGGVSYNHCSDVNSSIYTNAISMLKLVGGNLDLESISKLSALWYSYRLYTQYKELGETYAGAVRPEIHSAFWFKVGRMVDGITCAIAVLTMPKFDKNSPLSWAWGAFIVEKISNTYVRSQEYYARRQNL
jgi:hypothetical protein